MSADQKKNRLRIMLLLFLCSLFSEPIWSGVLTRGRIIYETSGLKKKDNEKNKMIQGTMESGTGLDDACENNVMQNFEFWDHEGKRRTGAYAAVDPAWVLDSVNYGPQAGLSGLYKPVPACYVRQGISYGVNSSLTGTLVLPLAGDVLSGTKYGTNGTEFTGTLVMGTNEPGTITNDATSGAVLSDREFWLGNGKRYNGKYTGAASSNVRMGVMYGSNMNTAGTYLADSTAGSQDVRYNKVSYSNGLKRTGELRDRGDQLGSDGSLVIIISNGIHIGKIVKASDSNLVADNIR
ncbi:MAG: hypothetical protein PHF84_07390, partial [bacterium]|nr:hypothetical protein [bacterium]